MSDWIDVNDRLPEKHQAVLIGKDDNIGHARLRFDHWRIIASNDRVPFCDVTHWMPLPEPPSNKD